MTTFIPAEIMEPTTLQALWFILIGVLVIGYFVLDGFDLGSGALYPFLAKDEKEKALVRRSIGPVWDGNEVWLLTGGGALFAAFAPAYATTFSGFYLAIMLVLFALIARAISVEFRAHDSAWHRLYDGAFFVGSALPALLFGVAIGNVIQGIPLDIHGDYAGLPLVGLLGIFPLTCGLVSLTVMILQGACWQALKAPVNSALRERALRVRGLFALVVPIVFVVSTLTFFLVTPHQLTSGIPEVVRYAALAFIVVAAVASIALSRANKDQTKTAQHADTKKANKRDQYAFIAVSVYPVALILLTAGSLFPYMVPSTGPGPSISVASAGSSELALTVMTIIACIGVPLVLIYHVVAYRIFRGRLNDADIADY
ncbi:MAG: cytochrome d ubiquinol oxidase subunit II [Coriobacteriales bacterium]|jgi:cytochrome d ubiquinol oxidase subunit II|nr:cytochrome d ubiquinol oxidase subunit II [Coriobacteriales bacterium]